MNADHQRCRATRTIALTCLFGLLVLSTRGFCQATPLAPASGSAGASPSVSIEIGLLGLPSSETRKPEWILKEIDAFMAAHPAIKVTALRLNDNRMETPLVDNPVLPRNIVGIFGAMGYETAYLAKQGEIVPIDKFMPDPEFKKDEIFDSLWSGVEFQGKTWGVPWATEAMVLACNEEMFAKAGIEFPKTWDAFLEACKLLTKDTNADGQIDQLGYWPSIREKGPYLMEYIAAQKGVALTTPDGFIPYTKEIDEVASISRNIVKTVESITRASEGRRGAFAMTLIFSAAKAFNDQPLAMKHAYRILNVPTCDKPISGSIGTHYFAIRKSTPAEEEASWQLIKWFSRKDVSLPSDLGGYPVRKDFTSREDFKAMAKNSYPGVEAIWDSNALPSAFVPCAVFNKASGLHTLCEYVTNQGLEGEQARKAWNTQVETLQNKNRVVTAEGATGYELFK